MREVLPPTRREKQFHLVDLVNEAIFHLKKNLIELPAFASLVRLAAHARHIADMSQCKLLNQSLSQKTKELLDALLESELKYQRTPFYELKEPPENPTAGAIQKEIGLLQRLRAFDISFETIHLINGEKILSISKNMYELCLAEQLIDGIIAGEITVCDSQYYSSMEESLISFSKFSANRGDYLQKLKLPENGEEFVRKLTDELKLSLNEMNRNYETFKPHTKVSRGSLSFTRVKKQKLSAEIEKLRDKVQAHMSNVSIIDILVDVDKLTGPKDQFETVGYREAMTREQKARRPVGGKKNFAQIIATLLCYGCNIGPAQTQRSTGVAAASILYIRRRYCSEENLLKVIGFLSDCQHQTWLAQSYGDGTGFITDGSMYSAPKRSMHTEPHFRYGKGRGVISYSMMPSMGSSNGNIS